jgi:GAF domain-containing protein
VRQDRVAQAWLMSRVDAECAATLRALVDNLAERLATAAGEAVSVRRLGPGGVLRPLVAHHPDPRRATEMQAVMGRTEDASRGLWAPVVRDGVVVRWSALAGRRDASPSSPQSEFIDAHAITAVIGAPLLREERVIGGVALVRFGVDRPFLDADEDLLLGFATRLAVVVDTLEVVDPVD